MRRRSSLRLRDSTQTKRPAPTSPCLRSSLADQSIKTTRLLIPHGPPTSTARRWCEWSTPTSSTRTTGFSSPWLNPRRYFCWWMTGALRGLSPGLQHVGSKTQATPSWSGIFPIPSIRSKHLPEASLCLSTAARPTCTLWLWFLSHRWQRCLARWEALVSAADVGGATATAELIHDREHLHQLRFSGLMA